MKSNTDNNLAPNSEYENNSIDTLPPVPNGGYIELVKAPNDRPVQAPKIKHKDLRKRLDGSIIVPGQIMKDGQKKLEKWEVLSILKYVKDQITLDPLAHRDYILLTILAYTGRRIGEVYNLKVGDVILQNVSTGVNIPDEDKEYKIIFKILKKKGHPRKIKDVPRKVYLDVLEYISTLDKGADGNLFSSIQSDKNQPMTLRNAKYRVYRWLRLSGHQFFRNTNIPVHPHTFRHSFAINAIRKFQRPSELRILQQVMEHSKLETTTFYLQFSDKEQSDLINHIYD